MEKRQHLKLARLVKICEKIKDPRRAGGNKRHELVDILVIALLAIICGCQSWEEIYDYATIKYDWLRTFLYLPGGVPSEPTFRRVFSNISSKHLEEMYREWVKPYVGGCLGKQICVDGKTICGAVKRGGENIHMVSAWVKEDGITLGQLKTDEKSNEITAIPKLLGNFDIGGSIVSIDAMGCQSEIAAAIQKQKAHYLLAVKKNQPTLFEEIKEYFDWAMEDKIERKNLDQHIGKSCEHGKIIKWKVVSTQDIVWFESKEKWAGLRSFVMVERTFERNGSTGRQTAYYISSLVESAHTFHKLIRGHWSIENQLHWMLDVAFMEDACLIGRGNAPMNLSLLRKMALTLIRLEASRKAGVARKMKMAAYDNAFALSICSAF